MIQPHRIWIQLDSGRHTKREEIRGIEPGIYRHQPEEAAHHQARSDEQHERERDLRDDERVTHTRPRARGRRALPAFLHRLREIRAYCLNRGREPEQDAGEHRHGEREQQNP